MNKFSKNISVAHSPDADDIFMYAAIAFGWASDERLKLSAKADDIESLNPNAKGKFKISENITKIKNPYDQTININKDKIQYN